MSPRSDDPVPCLTWALRAGQLGLIAKRAGKHRSYQANSVRHRNVLSTFTIGWQSLERKIRYRVDQLNDALALVQMHASCGFAW